MFGFKQKKQQGMHPAAMRQALHCEQVFNRYAETSSALWKEHIAKLTAELEAVKEERDELLSRLKQTDS